MRHHITVFAAVLALAVLAGCEEPAPTTTNKAGGPATRVAPPPSQASNADGSPSSPAAQTPATGGPSGVASSGGPTQPPGAGDTPPAAPAPPPQYAGGYQLGAHPIEPGARPGPPPPNAIQAPTRFGAASAPGGQTEVAAPGVGVQGKGYGNGDAGLITTPISAYFAAREQIAFDQIKHAMDLYKALNDHYPKTQEEFMDKIVKENGVQLPELAPGERYVYDPKEGQLLVEHPQK